jgi:Ca2+-binding RTX toxin-like protein
VLDGGAGEDRLEGGAGRDRLLGRDGDDQVRGGDHGDVVRGGDGTDEVWGGSGRDRIFGNGGEDYLFGDAGPDRLVGGSDDDLLQGGTGGDRLFGRRGSDELWGSECREVGRFAGHFCRLAPSGRAPVDGSADPDDVLDGGRHFDACTRGEAIACETERAWRGSSKGAVEEWRAVVERAFRTKGVAREIEHALQIVGCESLGDPFQVTPPTYATGLFQHLRGAWDGRAERAGIPGASPFDPAANALVAAHLVRESIDAGKDAWVHWTCDEILKNSGQWE